jgi:dTDP-glucose 4,6-dehydratase
VPITEDHPLQGQSPYSATKISADQLAYSFYSSFELPISIIRPFNTYGPRQSARAVIPTIISQILGGISEIKLGALSPTRDFSYVDDTVSGFIAALNADGIEGEVINLGSGYEISLGETVGLIGELMGCKLNIISDAERFRPEKSEVERLWADNSKAKKMMEWSPKKAGVEGLKIGLKETIDWFSKPKNLLRYKSSIYNI